MIETLVEGFASSLTPYGLTTYSYHTTLARVPVVVLTVESDEVNRNNVIHSIKFVLALNRQDQQNPLRMDQFRDIGVTSNWPDQETAKTARSVGEVDKLDVEMHSCQKRLWPLSRRRNRRSMSHLQYDWSGFLLGIWHSSVCKGCCQNVRYRPNYRAMASVWLNQI